MGAYSTPSRTLFRSDGGQRSTLIADTLATVGGYVIPNLLLFSSTHSIQHITTSGHQGAEVNARTAQHTSASGHYGLLITFVSVCG